MNRLRVEQGAAALADWMRRRGKAPQMWQPRVLRRSGDERLVIEFAPGEDARERAHAVIGKCYRRGIGADTFEAMQAVRAALREPPAARVLAVPKALTYDSERRCLLQQRVDAVSLNAVSDGAELDRYLYAAGRALAELHARHVAVGEKWLADHLAELMRPHPLELARALPRKRARIEALVARMLELELAWRERIVLAPVHRDFHPGQLMYENGRIWVVDWDLFARGDPALDVGNFLMCLETTRAPAHALAAGRAFLDGYFSIGAESLRRRIALYRSAAYLRRACKLYRLRPSGWQAGLAAMLERAEEALALARAAPPLRMHDRPH